MISFNSLQTGKRIASAHAQLRPITSELFQFPSNGKAYRKCPASVTEKSAPFVSIPFKRESVSQGSCLNPSMPAYQVSIPFKRESGSQDIDKDNNIDATMFQFPSNGKAYRKDPVKFQSMEMGNEFQFPSNGKAYRKQHRAFI